MRVIIVFFLFVITVFAQDDTIYPSSDNRIVKVVILPKKSTVFPGETIYFTFQAFTNENEEVPAAFSWRFGGGKLDHSGKYTAGDRPGKYEIEAEAPNGIKAVAEITIEEVYVTDNKPVEIRISPNVVKLQPGESCKFSFAAYNRQGNKVAVPLQIGFGGGNLDSKGNFVAGNQPGKYRLKVSTEDGLAGTADIFIGDIPSSNLPPTYIEISPKFVTLSPREKCAFTFSARDKFGEKVDCDMSISFSGGTIDDKGNFIAGDVPGQYKFEVFAGNISTSASIRIITEESSSSENITVEENKVVSKIVKEISITPNSVKLKPGEKQKFKFQAINIDGKSISPEINIQFSGGQFSGDGVFIAGDKPGKYQIVATSVQGHKAVAEIHILGEVKNENNTQPGTLSKIILTPKRIRVHPHESFKFAFNAVDKNGNRVPSTLSWSYQGGRMTEDGMYTPGYGYGQHYVTLEGNDGISATSIVAIIPKNEYVANIWLEIFPRQVELKRGESCYFDYRVTNEYEQLLDNAQLTWQFMGGNWNPKTKIFTAGDETGDYYLRAKYQDSEYITARAYIIIK